MLVLVMVLLLPSAVLAYPTIDATMCDNPYCIGYRAGAMFSAQIRRRLQQSASLPLFRAFYNTDHGKAVVQSMAQFNCERFERQHSELFGIAKGSGASYEDVLLINLRSELEPLVRSGDSWGSTRRLQQLPSDCTDYVVHGVGGLQCSAIVHNEDGAPGAAGTSYWVHARVNATPDDDTPPSPTTSAPRTWTAFTYAGELSTGAFAVSDAGFGYSINALFPRNVTVRGIARSFLLRRMLDARSADDALQVVTDAAPVLASGFNMNLIEGGPPPRPHPGLIEGDQASQARSARVWTIEVAPGGVAADVLRPATSTAVFHANEYRRLRVPEFTDPSSEHRLRTYEATYSKQAPAASVGMALLGDTSDPAYPFYRSGNSSSDHLVTLATALFANSTLSVLLGNPRLGHVAHRFPFAATTI
jgi:hypothetical protein